MTITAIETSRTTVVLITLPYILSIAVAPLAPGTNSDLGGWDDAAVIETGVLEPTGDYDRLILQELGQTSATMTDYGSGVPDTFDWFNLWNGKIFQAQVTFTGTPGDPANNVRYYYDDYSTGGSFGAVTFTTDFFDASWIQPHRVVQPLTWPGLTKPVVMMVDVDVSTRVARAYVLSGSGQSLINQVCVAPVSATVDPFQGPVDLIIPDTTKNWFLSRPNSSHSPATSIPVWTADLSGATSGADDLIFADSDVNTLICGFDWYGVGRWLVTPTTFVFYANRFDWDTALGNTPANGAVVVELSRDFTSYTIKFLTWGDADAQAVLDHTNNDPIIVMDGSSLIYYVDQFYVPGRVLSPSGAILPPPPPDPMSRFPPSISLGATGGPGFKTAISPGDRGTRFQEWDRVRGTYQIESAVKDQDHINVLLTFFRTRRGRAYPFRFKDWGDYQLPDPGSGLLYSDIFTTNVTGGTIQLVKVYNDLGGEYVRTITRPVYGTLVVYDNGAITTDYSADYSTGIITLGATLEATSGHVISVSCEFDVMARFDTDTMKVTIKSLEVYDWPAVPIVELFDG